MISILDKVTYSKWQKCMAVEVTIPHKGFMSNMGPKGDAKNNDGILL